MENNEKDPVFHVSQTVVYHLHSVFNFGKNKGLTILQVYKFEPSYIEWCINNLATFMIGQETLNLLKSIKIFDILDLFTKKLCNIPGNGTIIVNFNDISFTGALFEAVEVDEKSYSFSLGTLAINHKKHFMLVDYANNYCDYQDSNEDDDYRSYSEYGGAYGYDDDTMNSAFEGDLENYWNID